MFPRPMPSPAIPLAPEPAALSPVEAEERLQLREGLRLRRSVDHFARAWYGSIASLVLTGLALKLFHDHPRFGWDRAAVAALSFLGWFFALGSLVRSRRTARTERENLRRLQALEARAPKPPELF
jgi:hypothetical protein